MGKRFTLKDVENFTPQEIQKLTRPQLAQIVSDLGSIAKKRIARGIEYNIKSNDKVVKTFLYRKKNEYEIDFSTKGKNVGQLQHTLSDLRQFLSNKTTTIKEAKKHAKFYRDRKEKLFYGLTNEQEQKLLDVYEKTVELGLDNRYKYNVFEYVREEILSNGNIDNKKLAKYIIDNKSNEWYEDYEPEYEDMFSIFGNSEF